MINYCDLNLQITSEVGTDFEISVLYGIGITVDCDFFVVKIFSYYFYEILVN